MPRKTNWTDARGQTAAEYMGVLLLVAAIVAAIATLGLGGSIASGIERAVCSIAGAENCASASPESGGDADGADPAAVDRATTDLRSLVDANASPAQVAELFAGMDPDVARALAEQHPELVGNTNGAPIALRYVANREAMEREIARLEEAGDDGERLDMLRGLVAGDGNFLLFDPSGDGRIAQVFGDLETADNVALVVPGMNNELNNFSSANARRLYGQANQLDPGGTATIQWLGYDTPEGITAAFGGAADSGAQDLPGFVDGITAARSGTPPHLTVVAHSYGSLVTGKSLEDHGLNVDDVVFIGSPGVGASNVDELTDGSTDVWAGIANGDVIGASGNFGPPPTSPLFGAEEFHTGDISGHSSYFQEGSESLHNLGLIVTGNSDEVTTTR